MIISLNRSWLRLPNLLVKFLRDLRNREVQIFLFALALGTAAITAPALLAERLNSGVKVYTGDILGGDAFLSSPTPLSDELLQPAIDAGLNFSRFISFPSIVVNPDNANFRLASIKAVKSNYPLKGRLVATSILGDLRQEEFSSPAPAQGEIWLEEFLANILDITIGDKVSLGEIELTFTKYILEEPGRSSFFSFAPRAMFNYADLDATGLILPGSRINYCYLWSGNEAELNNYLDSLSPELQVNQRLVQANDESSNSNDILRRLKAFLLLSGSLCIFLSSFALLLCMRHFIDRNRRYVALLKTLGYSPMKTLLYLWQRIAPAALVAYVLGCLGGVVGYLITASYLAPVLPPESGKLILTPFAISGFSTIICLLSFAIPSLWRLAYLPPMSLLRPTPSGTDLWQIITSMIACAGIFVLLVFYSNDLKLAAGLFAAVIALLLIMGVLGYGVMKVIHDRLNIMKINMSLKIALTSIFRSWSINSFQILSFAIAFMLIGVLAIMRISLINDWQTNINPTTPNYFLVNIGPDKVKPLKDLLEDNNLEEGIFAGMVRGKLTKVDGEKLSDRTNHLGTYDDEAHREFNLGWSDEQPKHNQLIEGDWWDENGVIKDLAVDNNNFPVSVEEDIAKDFGIILGSRMEFVIGGRKIYGLATSIRRVDWRDFNPNFYVLFPTAALKPFPPTYMTSFYLPDEKKYLLLDLVKQFPTFSIISVARIIEQLKDVLALAANAMQLILLLSLLAAAAVFLAALQVSIDTRARTTATLRLIGQTSRQALNHNMLEFAIIGFLAGILAVLGSEAIVWGVYEFVLDQSFVPHYYFWFICPFLSTLLATAIGFTWTRRVIGMTPINALRLLN